MVVSWDEDNPFKAEQRHLIVQKLYHNSSLSAEFGDLHHADYQKATVLETDGTPVVDS
jgi:hypothetical protein